MSNDKDGARWRLWCRILVNHGEPECRELTARLSKVPKDIGALQAIDAMNAAMDEVLELYPEE